MESGAARPTKSSGSDARPSVEDGHQLGVGVLQLEEKEIGEEAMVAVPFPTVVERNDQKVGMRELAQKLA